MLYKQNGSPELPRKLFENPTSEYRGTPFWAWNCKLNKNELLRQIEQLKKMGFGGFHIHSRCGLSSKYLGDEFMDLVKSCTKKAEEENMLTWLYDEDRWPSGSAGGYVTKNPEFRAKSLIFSVKKTDFVPRSDGIKHGKPYLLACYDIVLNEDGTLKSYDIIDANANAEGNKWYAYIKTQEPSGWHNGQTYVDTMCKAAMDEFIKITYESYYNNVGDKFGSVINAIFTDEPQTSRKTNLAFSTDTNDIYMPWTTDFEKAYRETYNIDLISHLPEIVWDLPKDKPSQIRYFYHDLVCELFTRAFSDNCGKWCAEHNIALTGHVMEEPTLHSQTHAIGEAMRAYRSFGIPGIDMLCNRIELSTAKQAQSACHQYGREGMLSELYGVTNWDFDFRGHKFQGDWQAALGVTVRVPHLAWVSMKGSSKRDYPASIHYQSPWYKEYPYIENHFARLNTALTRGNPIVNVGVIHPIESYWLKFGPYDRNAEILQQLEDSFSNIINWLLYGTIDFDFISESLFPSQYGGCANGKLAVGNMNYSVILVPACLTLRSSTVHILTEFIQNGGRVIFIGDNPKYVDAKPSKIADDLYLLSEHISENRVAVLKSLENIRDISIKNANGSPSDNLIYNLRSDGDARWLFIARAKHPPIKDNTNPQNVIIQIKGEFEPIIYDTISGNIFPVEFHITNGMTVIKKTFYSSDSLLLKLQKPSKASFKIKSENHADIREIRILNTVNFSREEDNVYLLDMAEYSLDGGKSYHEAEEILRIDLAIRQKLNYPLAHGRDIQPWAIPPEKITQFPWLKFKIESEIDIKCRLAYEEAEEIILNGEKVAISENGFFVDHAIKTTDIPSLKAGTNELLIRVPIGKRISIENFFLLGNFDVKLHGCEKTIAAPSSKIGFGSVVNQGMPFYGGNITYKTKINLPEGKLVIRANYYRGALIRVRFDGKDSGIIVFDPFSLNIGHIEAGEHEVEFTLFGNRINTFGAPHNCGDRLKHDAWYGHNMWYTTGDEWSYDYQLHDMGIMASPIFEIQEN